MAARTCCSRLLQGEVMRGGWKDEHVKKSLDLCLSCKACKSECPANVDIATYKAEFLSHYYENKQRPLHAYAFGMVDRWLELASAAPGLTNFFAAAPASDRLCERRWILRRSANCLDWPDEFPAVGAKNGIPGLEAGCTRAPAPGSTNGASMNGAPLNGDVILWADTFNNYFHPGTGRAALAVLQQAGFRVRVPRQHLCCGRPFTISACSTKRRNTCSASLAALGPQIDAGVPIVVLEPSCASVFRDELRDLFPDHARATRLRSQTFLFSEFLRAARAWISTAGLARKVLLHGHCHHKAIMK